MENPQSLLLCEKTALKINALQKTLEIAILFLFVFVLVYRLLSLRDHGFVWLLAFACESWFAFNWVLILITQWTPVEYKTNPHNLLQHVSELPPVDMFVTTADAKLEPPIITVNTVLSLLAVDYPTHKLACYVSDDGCSPLTLYTLIEASKFAKLWVPFCKKYHVQVRAPFRYFSNNPILSSYNLSGFHQEWTKMKDEYEKLCKKIEDAVRNLAPLDFSRDYVDFARIDSRNHPTIIKVIWDAKERISNGLPHLVYVTREKRPNHSHHYKAGAMNALKIWPGLAGIQGPIYAGTGCFHRRKVIYGLSLTDNEGNLTSERLNKECFGNSPELIRSATQILLEENIDQLDDLSCAVEIAYQVAGSEYEDDTLWGKKVGWVYGSVSEDVLTGMKIHARGWKSILCTPEPPGFLGTGPSTTHVMLIQRKRWITGLLEILFSKNCPIFATLYAKLEFRQCLAYLRILIWGLLSVPDLCYALLPAYCIITNSHFLPKVEEPTLIIFAALFLIKHLYTLHSYLDSGRSIRAWWNQLTVGPWSKITTLTASLFGLVTVVFKLLGISEVTFEVTQKEQNSSSSDQEATYDANAGRFTFDGTTIFVPATALLFLQFTALVTAALGLEPPALGVNGAGIGEMMCSVWVVLCFWPFVKGLFGKGKYGIPMVTIVKSAVLAFALHAFLP
ncbi:cellulose synthase-like protein H1 isoform X3 [Malus domestica]|uniref:cellulose synthase-like protein H1 isoform X3 n=1 Tax=Malus domestica TaxID=3750 RepID=UPI00397512B9